MSKQPFSKSVDGTTHADVGWLSRQGLGHLGYAYREAAEALCEAPDLSGRSEEAMYLVASFAYRQSIELYLKALLPLVAAHTNAPVPQNLQGRHQLLTMWDWISDRVPLQRDARAVVEAFERVDPNGTAFRYNRDLRGTAQLERLPRAVSLGNLKCAASEVIHTLNAVEEFLSECPEHA